MSSLGRYVLKYAETDASAYFQAFTWIKGEGGTTEIKKAVRDEGAVQGFVSTMADAYKTKLEHEETLLSADRALDMRHFFQSLHEKTVTISRPGDSSSLLLMLVVPLFDAEACEEACSIIAEASALGQRYTVLVLGLCETLGRVVSPETFRDITADAEAEKKATEQQMLQHFAQLAQEQNALSHILPMQNINNEGFALNLDASALLRIWGELSLLCVEKYDTVFPPATAFDRAHPLTAFGLSAVNFDKYYFEDYLLRRSYIKMLQREDVTAEEVDLNKVAHEANQCLQKHHRHFSDFYNEAVRPLWEEKVEQDAIASQISPRLQEKFAVIEADLTAYIQNPEYSLPEKKAVLAMILGYDDELLRGNLFAGNQLTIDNLDEEVARLFIDANNACVSVVKDETTGKERLKYGPLRQCMDEDGMVSLPLRRMQDLREEIRQSTNYIREKNKELEEIEGMERDAAESEKRLTEEGFVVDGKLYRLDVKHEETRFDQTYEPKVVTEKSVDLRAGFTKVKDQGEIGACTVFSVSSIFEYILKQQTGNDVDLSEAFVYYNVRHEAHQELEDTGSSFQDVVRSIGERGICTEKLHPYDSPLGIPPTEGAYEEAKNRRITQAMNVGIAEADIKSAIQEGFPVAISLKVYASFNQTSGFVKRPSEEEMSSDDFGYHAMVIVGFTDETRHFVVRNSWGERFGDKGYCYIPYSYICDPELNRMACIVTKVAYAGEETFVADGGKKGKRQIVEFNTSDARIKAYVIENLLGEEQQRLARLQKRDKALRTEYETLMQTLGKQPVRTDILKRYQDVLSKEIAELQLERDRINESERAQELKNFDKTSWQAKIGMGGVMFALFGAWSACASTYEDMTDWFKSGWSYFLLGLFAILFVVLSLYSWYVKSRRRRLEMELEELTANLSQRISELQKQLEEQKLKMHVAGMIIDDLLRLKSALDKKYQGIKAYVGNLALWQSEEEKHAAAMDALVKDPFIPLLTNEGLDRYFDEKADEITDGMNLYEYFQQFALGEQAIIAYKQGLKAKVRQRIESLLNDFTIFRHIFGTHQYPFLDATYASAKRMLGELDRKSVPFCPTKQRTGAAPQARYLFIGTDAEEEQAWRRCYPTYFTTPPISENISSVLKIVSLRMQPLRLEELGE